MAPIFDYSVYGVNGHPTVWLSFSPDSPLRHGGLSWIVSPFLHLHFEHLITNMTLFVPVAMMMERKKSGKFLLLKFLSIHTLVLLALMFVSPFYPLSGKAFLGSSHVVIGLYCYWGLANKKYSMTVLALVILGIGLWQSQSPLTLLAHVLGFLIGFGILVTGSLWDKIRAKGTN